MYLTQKHNQTFPFNNPNPKIPKPFDEALIRRLDSLPRPSSSAVPVVTLVAAVDLLSQTLASFSALLSDPSLPRSEPDSAALSSHLDASASLLDAVNSISQTLTAFSRRRLHLSFALHLLSHRPLTADLTSRARASIAEWHRRPPEPPAFAACDLVRADPPRGGKASAIRRAIYAVEEVSALVVGLVTSFLGGRAELERIRVSSEFSWSESFKGVLTAFRDKAGGSATEIEAADSSVKELTATAFDDAERVRSLTADTEKKTEELTEGLDRLGDAVNELFRVALCTRNTALHRFRIVPRMSK